MAVPVAVMSVGVLLAAWRWQAVVGRVEVPYSR